MKAHIIDMPVLRPGDIVRGLGIDLAFKKVDLTAMNDEEVKKDESASVRGTSEEDES